MKKSKADDYFVPLRITFDDSQKATNDTLATVHLEDEVIGMVRMKWGQWPFSEDIEIGDNWDDVFQTLATRGRKKRGEIGLGESDDK